MEQVVCFKEIHSFRLVAWVITTQRPALCRRPFSIHAHDAVSWVDFIPEAVGIGSIFGAVRCIPPEALIDGVELVSAGYLSVNI